MALDRKLKTALDENRLLILGAQILAGFHLNGAFQEGFEQLGTGLRLLYGLTFVLMTLTLGLLIAPSMQHRLVERGEATARMHRTATVFAGAALLPFGVSLGLDLSIVLQRHVGAAFAAMIGATFFVLAMLFWFALEWLWRRDDLLEKPMNKEGPTPLHVKVEQMLTEARVLIPGAQALLGFQMAVLLTPGFDRLEAAPKLMHVVSLCCIALAVILLMAPAAFHRISYGGEDSNEFHTLGTRLVVAAALPLAAGISTDLFVVVGKAAESQSVGAVVAIAAALVLMLLWFAIPLLLRAKGSGP